MATFLHVVGTSVAAGLFCLALVYYAFLQPPKYPLGIPAIPFWVALIPLVQDVDQKDIFRKYVQKPLEEHGAVKMFFGSQWNVLVHRSDYIAAMFKNEDNYQKSGNQKKIPGSVLASFLGDNIISSYGDNWRLYQGIMKPGLQRSFEHDFSSLHKNAQRLCAILLDQQQQQQQRFPTGGVLVQEIFQRYTIANFAQALFRTDFGTLESSEAYLNKLQSSIKREIFKPIFMNFPFLDSLGFPSREKARRLASHFTDRLVAAVKESASKHEPDDTSTYLGDLLLAARKSGQLAEQQFRDNVTVAFVAGQENPQLGLLSTVYLLAKHQAEIDAMGAELPSMEAMQDMPLLTSVVLESLRLLPPIGQLINRRASKPLLLGDNIFIPQGTYLGYNCYSTNRDRKAWGPDAEEFRPERWGDTAQAIQKNFRRRKARSEFITFHGGRRACLGERFALVELKTTIFVLCRSLAWTLDPTWADKLTPVRVII
ncbi:Cytochrome P450 family protein [Trichoderma cornu-damae]|uniref:Cytochrome P450 family protein n=1 Tax=Trichoderma cornu-damae TaxID=654480 RepID=A0A9P8QFG9_9HYPO|nr:Cytochrome P450 family protein [Trichoderma cornu-damae]